jgi:DNA mismatch endonuclease (patch repair protein)
MGKVRSKNTKPEIIVRKLLYGNGYRYRLHKKSLPGSPDIVFHSRKKVIFVHGCFWHRHEGCKHTTTPGTRIRFWQAKFSANIQRDLKNVKLLKEAGWEVLIIWQCEVKDLNALQKNIFNFLESN